jgi:hypothetical protein
VGTDKPIEKICIRQDLNLQPSDPKRQEIPASSLLIPNFCNISYNDIRISDMPFAIDFSAQSSGRSPPGAIFTSLGSNWPSTVTKSFCAAKQKGRLIMAATLCI